MRRPLQVADPAKRVAAKSALLDCVHRKQYLQGTELEEVKAGSGIMGLEAAQHNLGKPTHIESESGYSSYIIVGCASENVLEISMPLLSVCKGI